MLFQTPEFLVFLVIVVSFFAIARTGRWRKFVLVLASCIFYMWWSPSFIILLLVPMLVDFNVARWLAREESPARRRGLLAISIVANLGLLGFFKYYVFFLQNLLSLIHLAGANAQWRTPDIALPIGISFYTFERLSYTIDVYRRAAPPTRSALDFSLFITFFPRLIAGPIVRASDFLPQLHRRTALHFDLGIFFLLLSGLMKKVIVADNLSPFVEQVFSSPAVWPSVVIWLAAIAFAIQIYCDFSGYSEMAIGLGRIFGLELPKNFDRPYFSSSPSDFWRRWHISLSTWLRDYVYVSLGGNRGGTASTYRNLMLTMLIGGFWHGASWNFVLWGFLHGCALVFHRMVRSAERIATSPLRRRIGHVFSVALMQYWVLLCWIPFRIRDSSAMLTALRKFVVPDGNFEIASLGLGRMSIFSTSLLMLTFLTIHAFSNWKGDLDARFARASMPTIAAIGIAAGVIFVTMWPLSQAPFIYFQF